MVVGSINIIKVITQKIFIYLSSQRCSLR